MKKCRIAWAALLVGAACLVAWFVLLVGEAEPIYQGRRVSDWLEDFDHWDGADTNAPIVLAIRALGTNAVPIIVKMSLWQDSYLKERLGVEFEKFPRLMRYRYTIAARRWQRAGQALSVMGEPAQTAVPYYLRVLTNGDVLTRRLALNALGSIGQSIGPQVEGTIPALLAQENDPDVRGNLMGALGDIGRRADLCVPLLIQALEDTNVYVRKSAMYGLGRFGAQATGAVPRLTRALDDKYTAREAASALKKIQLGEK